VTGTLLAAVAEIPVGGGKVFAGPKVVVTQPVKGQFKAFSAVCTHVGCVCNAVTGGTINCPCHGAKFKISDGAVVAGHDALARPDLLRRMVLIGQPMNHDGLPPGAHEMLANIAEVLPPMLAELYGAVSPDGHEHFAVIVEKLAGEWRTEPSFTLDELATIAAPCLVMLGDDDLITVAHADALRRTIPGSQVAVVPGATHALPMEQPDLAARLAVDFLVAEGARPPAGVA